MSRPITHVVSISGGKDSTATAVLALETMPRDSLRFVFADTGNEHEATYEYVEYLAGALGVTIERVRADFSDRIEGKRRYIREKWPEKGVPAADCERALSVLHPTGNPYLDLCLWKGRFPATRSAFCTHELKVGPITEHQMEIIDAGSDVWSWQGVRLEESASRRSRLQGTGACVRSFDALGGGLFNYRPILRWKWRDVFEAHELAGVKPNPLYLQGAGRVGCMPCINVGKDELLQIARRWPEHIERIAEWERLVGLASKRGLSTFIPAVDGARGDRQGRGIHAVVQWATTSRGGVQLDLTRTLDAPFSACSSEYGLCE